MTKDLYTPEYFENARKRHARQQERDRTVETLERLGLVDRDAPTWFQKWIACKALDDSENLMETFTTLFGPESSGRGDEDASAENSWFVEALGDRVDCAFPLDGVKKWRENAESEMVGMSPLVAAFLTVFGPGAVSGPFDCEGAYIVECLGREGRGETPEEAIMDWKRRVGQYAEAPEALAVA